MVTQQQIMIDVQSLVKRYGKLTAVNGISFQVKKGEIFGLLGPNGAGKSTSIEMMIGLRKPDGGTAILNGFDVQKQQDDIKKVIGIQLQSTSLFEYLKVKEIIEMYASFYPRHVDIDQLIEEMLLTEKKNELVKSLSGGQKQRLAIALALVHDPNIIFLDEPTTGLDPQARRMLWDIVLKLKNDGKTVVITTHYMDEAQVLCDRIGIIDQGNLIALDTSENLIRNLNTEATVQFSLEAKFDSTQFSKMTGVQSIEIHDKNIYLKTSQLQKTLIEVISYCDKQHLEIQDLKTTSSTLEDVFLHLTGRSLREE